MKLFFSFIKIEHTLFSLPIVFSGTLLAVFLIPVKISTAQFFWIFLAAASARAYGFSANRMIDREIDSLNPRTQKREIPSGKLSIRKAWIFMIGSGLFFVICSAMLSKTCFYLSFLPLFLFTLYPFLKRWTLASHFGLGLAWGIAPFGGWFAVHPWFHPFQELLPPVLLAGFCVFWVAGFDILYAFLDQEFDREKGLYSIPAVLGTKNAIRISELTHLLAFLFLGILVQHYLAHWLSFGLLGAAGFLFILSHWKVSRGNLTPKIIDFAFFKVNAVLGFVVFFIILAGRSS